jgi:hypothetical protein
MFNMWGAWKEIVSLVVANFVKSALKKQAYIASLSNGITTQVNNTWWFGSDELLDNLLV